MILELQKLCAESRSSSTIRFAVQALLVCSFVLQSARLPLVFETMEISFIKLQKVEPTPEQELLIEACIIKSTDWQYPMRLSNSINFSLL